MKKYITPSIATIAVDNSSQVLAVSEAYNKQGDGVTGQLSRRRYFIPDDDEDLEDK